MLFLRAWWCLCAHLLATPVGALHRTSSQPPVLPTPNQSEAVKSTIVFQNQPIPNPFKNILLVVHCRLPKYLLEEDPHICDKRRPLYQGYRKYFGEMMWMTRDNCKKLSLEPHTCLIKVIQDHAAQRDGIFYLHFDALIRPSALAPTFDPTSMAFFGREDSCDIGSSDMKLMNCSWGAWGRWNKVYLQSIERLKARGIVTGLRANSIADPRKVWIGMDDVFYLPRRVFGLYTELTRAFQVNDVHHEVAGPTMRRLLARMTDVQDKNMSCSGDCCHSLGSDIALKPDFRCGHAFRLQEPSIRDAFESVLSLDRWQLLANTEGIPSSMDVMQKIMDEATA